jgi:hypothetical protein
MMIDYPFQITRNSGYEERLLISNYKTPQLWRMTAYFKSQDTPVMKNDCLFQITRHSSYEE